MKNEDETEGNNKNNGRLPKIGGKEIGLSEESEIGVDNYNKERENL